MLCYDMEYAFESLCVRLYTCYTLKCTLLGKGNIPLIVFIVLCTVATFVHLVDAFIQSGNRTHDLGVASTMLFCLSMLQEQN